MTHYVHTGTVRDRAARQAGFALRPRERGSFIMLTHLHQRFWTATVSARRDICQYDP